MSAIRAAIKTACVVRPKLVCPEPLSWNADFVFPKESVVFAGHFDNNPVLPAVIQIMLAEMLLAELGMDCQFVDAKFLQPIGPDEHIKATVSRSKRFLVCSIVCRDACAAKLRFAEEGSHA